MAYAEIVTARVQDYLTRYFWCNKVCSKVGKISVCVVCVCVCVFVFMADNINIKLFFLIHLLVLADAGVALLDVVHAHAGRGARGVGRGLNVGHLLVDSAAAGIGNDYKRRQTLTLDRKASI